jgi:hypothetical protein
LKKQKTKNKKISTTNPAPSKIPSLLDLSNQTRQQQQKQQQQMCLGSNLERKISPQ